MKKTILFIAFMLIGFLANAQTEEGFNFKGLLTDNGTALSNQLIAVRVTIYKSGTLVWQETHTNVHTDNNGIFSIVIGEGARTAGVTEFDEIDWSSPNTPNFRYKIEIDTGSGYNTFVDNVKFKRVPFAKIAESLERQYGYITFGEPTHENLGIKFRSRFGRDITIKRTHSNAIGELSFIYNNNTLMQIYQSYVKIPYSLEVDGKIKAPSSGNADMKAYAYGFVDANGNIIGGSDNFTVVRQQAGYYKITLTGISDNSPANCFIVATPSDGAGNASIRAFVSTSSPYDIIVKTMNGSSTSLTDKKFQFVVFRK